MSPPARVPRAIPDNGSLSVSDFCALENVSPSTFYKERRQGRTPDEMIVAGMIRITPQAHTRWRRKREKAARKAAAKTESPTK
jgi:hypothetical protein